MKKCEKACLYKVVSSMNDLLSNYENRLWLRDELIMILKNGKMYTRQTDQETGLQQVVRYKIVMIDE